MKKPRDKHLGIMFDSETHYKLKYVANYAGRSASGQVLHLIRQYISSFEQKHGEIPYPPEEEDQ